MNKKYLAELEPAYTPLTVCEEASRCLLCLDAPCSKDCPAGTDPGRFIRAVRFRNFKGAAEVVRENNALGSISVYPTAIEFPLPDHFQVLHVSVAPLIFQLVGTPITRSPTAQTVQ